MINVAATGDGTARSIPADSATVSLEAAGIGDARSVRAAAARVASQAYSRGSRSSAPAATGVPGPRPFAVPDPDLERLGDEIAELAAHVHAATYRLLVRLRAFDERGGWGGGFRSCAHWLSWRTGIGLGARARAGTRGARARPAAALERSDASRRIVVREDQGGLAGRDARQ